MALSSRLNTLRDRYGVNEIAESELKMVRLASCHIALPFRLDAVPGAH